MPTTVNAAERSWVRLSPAVICALGLAYGVFSTAHSRSTQIYLACMLVLMVATIVTVLAYRYVRVAREARGRTDASQRATTMLFTRAILVAPGSSATACAMAKGWVTTTPDDITIWEAGNPAPVAVYSLSGASVEPLGGNPFARPIARFRFGDDSRFDAVVVRPGLADVFGWSASQIRSVDRGFNTAVRDAPRNEV